MQEYLRLELTVIIEEALEHGVISIKGSPSEAADIIFTMVDGSYFYLSLFENDVESTKKLELYRMNTYNILNLQVVNSKSIVPISSSLE